MWDKSHNQTGMLPLQYVVLYVIMCYISPCYKETPIYNIHDLICSFDKMTYLLLLVYTRTEINFNTQERFFAPTVEIMEQKWPSQ